MAIPRVPTLPRPVNFNAPPLQSGQHGEGACDDPQAEAIEDTVDELVVVGGFLKPSNIQPLDALDAARV